jgi:hypothetical protein
MRFQELPDTLCDFCSSRYLTSIYIYGHAFVDFFADTLDRRLIINIIFAQRVNTGRLKKQKCLRAFGKCLKKISNLFILWE